MPVENAGSLPTLAPGVTAIYFQEAGSNAVAPAVIAQLQVYTPMYDIHNVCLVSGGARVEAARVWVFIEKLGCIVLCYYMHYIFLCIS